MVDEVRVRTIERTWGTRSGPATGRVSYLSGTIAIVVECLVLVPCYCAVVRPYTVENMSLGVIGILDYQRLVIHTGK